MQLAETRRNFFAFCLKLQHCSDTEPVVVRLGAAASCEFHTGSIPRERATRSTFRCKLVRLNSSSLEGCDSLPAFLFFRTCDSSTVIWFLNPESWFLSACRSFGASTTESKTLTIVSISPMICVNTSEWLLLVVPLVLLLPLSSSPLARSITIRECKHSQFKGCNHWGWDAPIVGILYNAWLRNHKPPKTPHYREVPPPTTMALKAVSPGALTPSI